MRPRASRERGAAARSRRSAPHRPGAQRRRAGGPRHHPGVRGRRLAGPSRDVQHDRLPARQRQGDRRNDRRRLRTTVSGIAVHLHRHRAARAGVPRNPRAAAPGDGHRRGVLREGRFRSHRRLPRELSLGRGRVVAVRSQAAGLAQRSAAGRRDQGTGGLLHAQVRPLRGLALLHDAVPHRAGRRSAAATTPRTGTGTARASSS